jgi:hypothetical protein
MLAGSKNNKMPAVIPLSTSALACAAYSLTAPPSKAAFSLLQLTGTAMAKLTLTDESSGYQTTTQRNANYAAIETALENTLSRDGTSPNAMGANLDMNNNKVINLAAPTANSDAARWVDVASAVGLDTTVPSQTSNGGRLLMTTGSTLVWQNAQVVVDNVAAMQALTGLATGVYVYCAGYYTKGDLGAGLFYYDSASAATADGGSVVTPTTLSGRFLRVMPRDVTPQLFGAKADGSTDDKVAIQACLDYVYARRGFTNNGFSGSASVGYADFPPGVYRVSGTVTVGGYATLRGDRASFKPDAGVTVFTASVYQTRFDNLVFIGGAKAIYVETGNVDTSTCTIENCEFQDQTVAHIETSALSASTLFRIKHCKFYSNSSSTAFIGIDLKGGSLHLTACWVTTAQTFIRNGDGATGQGGTVILDDLFGVPRYAGNGGVTWVYNTANLIMRDCRFGGEADGVIVDQRAPVTATQIYVIIDSCGLFPGDQPIVTFNYMPDFFSFTNNQGVTNSWEKGFLFNDGSTSTYGTLRGETHSFIVEGNTDTNAPNYQGNGVGMSKAYTFSNEHINKVSTLFVADKVAQYQATGGAGWTGSAINVSTTTPTTDSFGAPVRAITGTSSSYNGLFLEYYTNGLTGLSNGMYTVVVNVHNNSEHIASVQVLAGGNEKTFRIAKGRHVLNLPTYFVSGTDSERVGFSFSNANSAQVVVFGNVRVFSGAVDVTTENNILYSTAAPITLQWEKGDRVINSNPTVGQPKAWVCTVAGAPGTWVSEGNL